MAARLALMGALVCLSVSAWAGTPEPPAREEEPAWISRNADAGGGSAGTYRGSALRSMGVLLLLIGSLLAVHYWFRRRMATEQAWTGSNLKVRARLRLGVRQEVVVVDWGEDQLILGVGPTFIRPLHIRQGTAVAGERHQEEPEPHE